MILWQVLRQTIVLSILVYPPLIRVPLLFWFSVSHTMDYIYHTWQNQQTKNQKVNLILGTCILLIWAVFWTASVQKEMQMSAEYPALTASSPTACACHFFLNIQYPSWTSPPVPTWGIKHVAQSIVLYHCSCVLDKNEMWWCRKFCPKLWLLEVVFKIDVLKMLSGYF